MTSALMKIDEETDFEYFYPHGVDCLIVLVPTLRRRESYIFKIVHESATILILVTFLMYVMIRILMKCTPISGWFSEFMATLGIFLAQKFIRSPKSTREYIWNIGLLMFAYVAVIILSSILYRNLVVNQYGPEIDTAQQLADLDLKIFVLKGEQAWTTKTYYTNHLRPFFNSIIVFFFYLLLANLLQS